MAAVEFAIIAPLLIFLLWGAVSYGGYFMLAHTVQQIANDASRAAIAGLDDAERLSLVNNCVQQEAHTLPAGAVSRVSVSAATAGDNYTVTVNYDASGSAFFAFAQLGPMPSNQISGKGTILLGGF